MDTRYYIVRAGGRPSTQSFLLEPGVISIPDTQPGANTDYDYVDAKYTEVHPNNHFGFMTHMKRLEKDYTSEEDFGTIVNAHKFMSQGSAWDFIKQTGDFSGSVIIQPGYEEIHTDPREEGTGQYMRHSAR